MRLPRPQSFRPVLNGLLLTCLVQASPAPVTATPATDTFAMGPTSPVCTTPIPTRPLALADVRRTIDKTPRYTQGLLVHDGHLYESTGMNGHSGIFRSALDGTQQRQLAGIGSEFFGEGLAILADQAFYLTWQAERAFRYDLREDGTLAPPSGPATVAYAGQGWGLTAHGKHLLMSDGSADIQVLSPADFSVSHRLRVRAGTRPVRGLNELETAGDWLLANIYGSSAVAVIDINSGCVELALDASALVRDVQARLPGRRDAVCNRAGCNPADFVLNGIAFDADAGELYLTGKNWPLIYVLADPLPSQPAAD
jgi:glutamine cyclotransferase